MCGPVQLEKLFEISSDLLCVTTTSGQLKRANPAFLSLFGFNAEELLARSWTELVYTDDQQWSAKAFANVIDGDAPVELENRCQCENGSLRRLKWRLCPPDDGGLICAAAHDVTDIRELQSQAKRFKHLVSIGALAGDLAHELSNSLQIIIGNSDLLLHDPSDLDQLRELLQEILCSAQKAGALMGRILDVSAQTELDLDAHPEAPEQNQREDSVTAGLSVLVVDDESPIVLILQQMLSMLGHNVTAATDGGKALELLQGPAAEVDLIITDQAMPTMTGADLAREIRRLRFNLPIILMSGYDESVTIGQGLPANVHFLKKPITKQELADAIEQAIAG